MSVRSTLVPPSATVADKAHWSEYSQTACEPAAAAGAATNSALFVLYEFPPEGSRGTKRSIKFIHHLPRSGWRPVVLTVFQSPNYTFHDSALTEELAPDLAIYRARTLESCFRQSGQRLDGDSGPKTRTTTEQNRFSLRRLLLWFYHRIGRVVKIPDSRILWLPFAIFKGLRAIRENQCRVIYTSGPSHTNHIAGAILSRLSRLPLILDFRDAWVGNPAKDKMAGFVKRGNCLLERFCVKTATFVVCTTDGIKKDFETRYPNFPKKYVTITNGFDPLDFPCEKPKPPRQLGQRLTITHAGTLGGERSPKEFLVALGELLRDKPELRHDLEVIFVGQNAPFADGRTIKDYIDQNGCGSVVKLTGYVSRKMSLEYISQADVLLLIIGRVPAAGAFVYGISGKIYDYAAARRRVLTISEPGASADIAERLNLGSIIHPDHTADIKAALLELCEAHKAGSIPYHPNLTLLKSFEFASLSARLAECFDKASLVSKPSFRQLEFTASQRDSHRTPL